MTDEPHTHHEYDEEIGALEAAIAEMGRLAGQQLDDGLRALRERDAELGHTVCTSDYRINELEVRIDRLATAMIARRQPTGSDLRFVIAAIRTGTDLERVGDEAGKLGRFAIEFAGSRALESRLLQGMQRLGEDVQAVFRRALEARAARDAEAAAETARAAEHVARVQGALLREFVTYMLEDPRTIQRVLHALWCTRALERIANHAANICESVVYVVEGRNIRHAEAAPE